MLLVSLLAFLLACGPAPAPRVAAATGEVPRYDHIVVVVEENHSHEQIIGNPAAPPLIAPIPSFSSADTIRRATAFASSVVWWNSRLEIDRAGVRIFSRFIRMTKLMSVLALGKTA